MLLRSFIVLWLFLLSAGAVECCTIPVFRYALDRWDADKLHLVLPAASSGEVGLQDLLRPLRANGKANLEITTSRDPALTQAQLRDSKDSDRLVWSGRLDQAALGGLLDSPARQKILESILAGDSVIWVIASDDSAQEASEVERIEKRLKFLEQVASLPIQDPNDPDSQLGPGPPLRLRFATMRLRRDDPGEKVLLKMLAGHKGEIDPEKAGFAAAVFGRGRVLGAWALNQLDDASLEDASMFLVGRCGCRIKNENPGWDILLNVDWEKTLQAATQGPKPAAIPALAPSVVTISPAAETPTEATEPGNKLWVGILLGVIALAVGVLRAKMTSV